MIKVSRMYPNAEGARFDHAYYRDKHIPMLKDRLGDALIRCSVDRCVAGATSEDASPYLAMAHLYFESMEAFKQAYFPQRESIVSDIENFTDTRPVAVISEVVFD